MRKSARVTKFSRLYREVILPAGLLASLIIGAGMFALPYLFNTAGILTGIFYLIASTFIFIAVHLRYGEVIEKTPGKHRFAGYAELYLGKRGFWAGAIVAGLGLTLVLTAYLALGPVFLRLLTPGFGDSLNLYLFWGVGATAILFSLNRLKNFEFLAVVAMLAIILALFGFGLAKGGDLSALPAFNPAFIFLPYGAVLFALYGRPAISSLKDYFEENKLNSSSLRRAIILGTATPAVFYLLLVLGVAWLSPQGVSPDSLSGLLLAPSWMVMFIGILGIFAIWTSYFLLGLEVKNIFRYDFKMPSPLATFTAAAAPLALYLLGLRNFIGLVTVVGGVFLAAESVMVILMHHKLQGRPHKGELILIAIFILGGLYEIFKTF